jgi:hypothetical protein
MPLAVALALHLAITGRIARPLSTLVPGEALKGTIVHRHEELLYVKVDVDDDTGKRVAPEVDAMLKLKPTHRLLKEPSIGTDLTVYVKGVTGGARLRVGLYPRRATPAAPPDDGFLRLDRLKPGDSLEGVVVATAACGVFVDAGVWRQGPRARWCPVEALLPPDQQAVLADRSVASIAKGALVRGRVLDANVASGKLLMTTRDEPAELLVAELRERRRLAKARQRRKSTGKLQAGAVREGVVVRLEPYGLVINVGAKQTGLAHISNLGAGLVEDVGELAEVGDVVLVQVRAVKHLMGVNGREMGWDKGWGRESEITLLNSSIDLPHDVSSPSVVLHQPRNEPHESRRNDPPPAQCSCCPPHTLLHGQKALFPPYFLLLSAA